MITIITLRVWFIHHFDTLYLSFRKKLLSMFIKRRNVVLRVPNFKCQLTVFSQFQHCLYFEIS